MAVLPLRQEGLLPFAQELFDRPEQGRKAAAILWGILAAHSPRLSGVAQAMPRSSQANYKAIQPFLAQVDPREVLLRLWDEEAPHQLADPTEVPRREARRTDYVGRLADGRALGFWRLLLARPYKGRALPCHFITYSEGTIKGEASCRNLEHRRALGALRRIMMML